MLPGLCLFATLACAQGVPADSALAPAPVVLNPGREYAVRPFQGIPGIERSRKGRLWAVWYAGGKDEGPENYVLLVTSGDNGRNWSGPVLVVDPRVNVRAYDPCLWLDPHGRLWLFWAQAAVKWDGRGGVWAIRADKPDSAHPKWSTPRRISDGVMMNKPTVTRDGRWLLPVGGWRNIRPNAGAELSHQAPHLDSGVVVSSDNGKSFQFLGEARIPDAQFDEHMIVEKRDGSLWMLVRTTYGIGQSTSLDGGRSWSPGTKYMDHVVTRFFIRRLTSGQLLMVRHNPPGGKGRSHLTAYLSGDDGATWQGGLLLDDRKNVSYPDGVQGPDGTIFIIYDHERYGVREILMATFSEADVSRGVDSPKVGRRVVVNRTSE